MISKSEAAIFLDERGVHATYSSTTTNFVTLAYTRNSIDQEIPITFIFPFFGNPTTNQAMQDLADNVFTVATDLTVSDSLPLGIYGSASLVSSDSDDAGFLTPAPTAVIRLNYYDLTAGARYTLPNGVFFDGQGRFIDYRDDGDLESAVIDDYDAAIFTFAVGFRFR